MTEPIDLEKWIDKKALLEEGSLLLNEPVEVGRHLVMAKDLNPAKSLFGGQLMSWLDEAAALYVMCQLNTKDIVTIAVTNLVFKERIQEGDFVKIVAWNENVGMTSITIGINVYIKHIGSAEREVYPSVNTSFTFVTVDPETGKKKPHGKTAKKE